MLLDEENIAIGESALPLREFSETFLGNVDLLQDQSISGWVSCTEDPNRDVKVALWIGSRCIVELAADAYRADLESIRSDGRCSFELKFPPMLASVTSKTRQPVRLIASTETVQSVFLEDVFKESTNKASEQARERTREAFWLAHVLHSGDGHTNDEETRSQLDTTLPAESDRFVSQIHAPRSAQNSSMSRLGAAGAEVPEVSQYLSYTLERLKLDSLFNVDDNPWEASEALQWYIEGYGSTRKPLRVPLSKEEISYCNAMLHFPSCRFQMSRAHYFHLLKHRPGFAPASVLNDEAIYKKEVFDWVNEISVDLNMADILVPIDYIDTLKQLRPHWKDRRFPLNDYFEIRQHKHPTGDVFCADSAIERGLMYLVSWLECAGKPGSLQFMPEKVWIDLFEVTNEDGLTFYEEIAVDVLDDLTLSDVQKLRDSIIKSQRALLFDSGFNLDSLSYETCDRQGNRRHLPYPVLSEGVDERCDLQVIGPFGSASGLGQATRLSVLAMREAGLNPHLVNFDLDNPAPTGFSTEMKCGAPRRAKVNLVHLNAEAAPFVAAYLPDIFSNSYNIGYFFWELDSPAKCHALALEMFDEVWVSTKYGVKQYSERFDNPVINVGMTFEEQNTPPKEECRERLNKKFKIESDEIVFLTTFDSFSFVQRKNPKAVIRSFLEAFPNGDERVRLILKTQNRHSVLDPVQQKIWKSIDNLISLDSRIMFVNETMNYSDLLWFKKAADCYVSLHRSEGWGFGMIESMMLDVPVIATGYSGNLEFCKEEHCWLVETEETYLDHNDYIFVVPGQKWGDPSVSHAAACMVNAYEDRQARSEKANRAREFVRDNFCPLVIGQRYADRLKTINDTISWKESVTKAA